MDAESPDDRAARLLIEDHVRAIGGIIRDAVNDLAGPGFGFALLMFDFGEVGNLAYMSNARRDDMIEALDECRRKLEASSIA